jgi:hypothetical protein
MREKPTEPGQPSGECESIYFALSLVRLLLDSDI